MTVGGPSDRTSRGFHILARRPASGVCLCACIHEGLHVCRLYTCMCMYIRMCVCLSVWPCVAVRTPGESGCVCVLRSSLHRYRMDALAETPRRHPGAALGCCAGTGLAGREEGGVPAVDTRSGGAGALECCHVACCDIHMNVYLKRVSNPLTLWSTGSATLSPGR